MATKNATITIEERDYSVEEVGEMIRTASSLARSGETTLSTPPRDTLAFSELTELARELGIPQELLRKAIPEADARRKRAMKRTRRKMRFWRHLFTYLPLMGGVALLDLLGTPGLSAGFILPATLWGIIVVMHGLRAYVTGPAGHLHRRVLAGELEKAHRER